MNLPADSSGRIMAIPKPSASTGPRPLTQLRFICMLRNDGSDLAGSDVGRGFGVVVRQRTPGGAAWAT